MRQAIVKPYIAAQYFGLFFCKSPSFNGKDYLRDPCPPCGKPLLSPILLRNISGFFSAPSYESELSTKCQKKSPALSRWA